MARHCTICRSSNREDVDRDLVAGVSLRQIGVAYGVGKDAVARHRPHIGQAARRVQAAREADQERRQVDHVGTLRRYAETQMALAGQLVVDLRSLMDPMDRLRFGPATLAAFDRATRTYGLATGEFPTAGGASEALEGRRRFGELLAEVRTAVDGPEPSEVAVDD